MRKTAVTLSLLLLLSTPLKAPAATGSFDSGGFFDGISSDLGGGGGIGGFFESIGITPDLLSKLDFYSEIGKIALKAIQSKSISSIFSALPSILGKFDANSDLLECDDSTINCDGLFGEAGSLDWDNASKKIEEAVSAGTKDSDGSTAGDGGAISPGITDPRFRPRITRQLDNTKIATWTQVQNAQYQAITGVDGQKATKEGRDAVGKVVEASVKTTEEIQKLDNTQDIIKKNALNSTYSISLQQRQILEQEQSKFAQYDGNQTANEQLSIQQKAAWEDEVRQSQSLLSANAEGDAFSDFVTSAYASP
jgi:hypothetical protein